jgi:thioredoxin-related protein
MITKQFFFLFLLFCGLYIVKAQKKESINWKSWNQLEETLKVEPTPVFIFFHAEWCVYCKKIERQIFTNPAIIQKINESYYAVEMDVERTDTITFDGTDFTNKQALKQRNGIHEIALLLASRDQVPFSLPATILLNTDFTVKNRLFEYYTSNKLLKSL